MESDPLFIKIRQDDRDAFELLVLKYNESLHAFAYRYLQDKEAVEDIVQDVFVNIWLHRKRLQFDQSVKNLLYVSTRNMVFNYIRSKQREGERNNRFLEENQEDFTDAVVLEEALRLLSESVEKLPPRMAEVIRFSLEGLKQEEIAERMEVSVANVKRLKRLAVDKLRQMLGSMAGFVLTVVGLV